MNKKNPNGRGLQKLNKALIAFQKKISQIKSGQMKIFKAAIQRQEEEKISKIKTHVK